MSKDEAVPPAQQAEAGDAATQDVEPLPLGMDETLNCLRQDIRDSLATVKSSQQRACDIAFENGRKNGIEIERSSQQEEMARLKVKLMGERDGFKCDYYRMFGKWNDALIKLASTEAAHLAEQAKTQEAHSERVAQIAAHRSCIGLEHDPANGKLHGYCVVCGYPWPCEYAVSPYDKWKPTSEAINALPKPIRSYICDLETRCDPSGDTQTLAIQRENLVALEKKLTEAEQTSLASQAKLIRKCAKTVRQSMGDCGCELTTGHFSDCGVRQEQNVLSLITPEMKVSEK